MQQYHEILNKYFEIDHGNQLHQNEIEEKQYLLIRIQLKILII